MRRWLASSTPLTLLNSYHATCPRDRRRRRHPQRPRIRGHHAAAGPADRQRRQGCGPAAGRGGLGGRRRRRNGILRARQGSELSILPDRSAGRCRNRWDRRSLHSQMILARVVGTVVATQKRPQFEGAKLLLVQPETPQGEAKGNTLLAIDSV